jgi:hypothetical protein
MKIVVDFRRLEPLTIPHPGLVQKYASAIPIANGG